MKYLLLILSTSILLSAELEVDGDLKVTGTVDANGNPITNVGAALSMTDAINGNVLQSALRDDGIYEYLYYNVVIPMFNYGWDGNSYQYISKYKSWDFTDEGDDWNARVNTLSQDGWIVVNQFLVSNNHFPTDVFTSDGSSSYAHHLVVCLKKYIEP